MSGYAQPFDMAVLTSPVACGPDDDAETVLLQVPIGADDVLIPGTHLELRASGIVTTVSGAPVIDLRLRLGPATLTGAVQATWRVFCSNNQTTKTWVMEAHMTVQPDGLSAWSQGAVESVVNTQFQFGWVGSEQLSAVAFDPTVANLLELTADWDDLDANIWKMTNASVIGHRLA
jgi:hypothetical protein